MELNHLFSLINFEKFIKECTTVVRPGHGAGTLDDGAAAQGFVASALADRHEGRKRGLSGIPDNVRPEYRTNKRARGRSRTDLFASFITAGARPLSFACVETSKPAKDWPDAPFLRVSRSPSWG